MTAEFQGRAVEAFASVRTGGHDQERRPAGPRLQAGQCCRAALGTHPAAKNNRIVPGVAFNAMLRDGPNAAPLVMRAGDTITVHFFVTPAKDGRHIKVADLATGHSGTIVLNDHTDGPLMPAFSVQKIGNSLAWGIVHDAPASFVWEIGHTSPLRLAPARPVLHPERSQHRV